MRRFLPLASFLALIAATIALAQNPPAATPPPAIPADLDGRWVGEAHHGTESTAVALEFERKPDGRVLVHVWFPELNLYGTAIEWLAFTDGKFNVRALGGPLALNEGTLSGQLFSAELKFDVRRGKDLPVEAVAPATDSGPAPAWTFHAGAPVWGSPEVADGIAYLGDTGGHFHAIRTRDGTEAWSFDAHTPLFADAAVTADAVYFAGDDSQLHKLDRASGRELWKVDLGGGDMKRSAPAATSEEWDHGGTTPVVRDGVVYAGSIDGTFHALDMRDGHSLWTYRTGGKIRAAALATGDRVYVGSRDHFVYALDRRTGALAWRFDTGSPVTSPPVLAAGRVVIGTRDKATLFALDAASGQVAWTIFYWTSWVESAPVLVDGVLYAGSSDNCRIRAVDPQTGRVLWVTRVWGGSWGTPLVVGDTVYYGTAGPRNYAIPETPSVGALDRRTGALKWRHTLPFQESEYVSGIPGSLVRAENLVLAASEDGTLTAYPLP